MSTLLGCSWEGSLITINAATGAGTAVGVTGFEWLNSLASDRSGTLYSVAGSTFSGSTFSTPLITIDSTTGAGTFVTGLVPIRDIHALAFSPTNVLFGIWPGGEQIGTEPPPSDDLVTINVTTGAVTLVGNTRRRGLQAIAFSSNGTLYGWVVVYGGLVTINTSTGVATLVNPSATPGSVPDIQGLAFAPNGTLYGARESLFTINVTTGATTLVGSGGYADLRGIAFISPVVRVPPSIIRLAWLWMILSGGILITPIGPLCIVCGDPIPDFWVRVFGLGSIVLGGLGLWREIGGSRTRR